MTEDNQDKKSQLADESSIIRVLNGLGAKVRLEGETIFFKLENKEFINDLESLANTYAPLTTMKLHECDDGQDCSIHGYYYLRVCIQPRTHEEAAHALYKLLEKYTKDKP